MGGQNSQNLRMLAELYSLVGDYSSIQDRYSIHMFNMMSKMLASKDARNLAIPTVGYISEDLSVYRGELLDLYNSRFPNSDDIPLHTKVNQASLLDSPCFCYNMTTGTYALYTCDDRSKIIYANKDHHLLVKKIIKVGDRNSGFKLNINKEIEYLDVNVFDVVPLAVVIKLLNIIENLLSNGLTLGLMTEQQGIPNPSYISTNKVVLRKYLEDAKLAVALEPTFDYINGTFYAPSIGVPTMNSLVTCFNVFDLSEVKIIKNINELDTYGVEKAPNSMKNLIQDQLIIDFLMSIPSDLEGNGLGNQILLNKMPYANRLYLHTKGGVSRKNLQSYLDTLFEGEKDSLMKIVPNYKEESQRLGKVFSKLRYVKPTTKQDLLELLKNKSCALVIQGPLGAREIVYCSNNKSIYKDIFNISYIDNEPQVNKEDDLFYTKITRGVSGGTNSSPRLITFNSIEAILVLN